MCGIAGLISKHPANTDIQNHILPMVKAVSHRGPDGEGIRIFSPPELPCAVALGHKRLAVIDLTEKAAQPMCNEDRTVWIVFNGEIYNFLELRKILERKGHIFRSFTDTEVIIHLYEDTGLDFINQLTGMFAFAILDIPSKKLILARDHTGIKPLYYWNSPHYFLFGSEIKSILASRLYSVEINWQSVYDYFTYLYPPCPGTVFQNIYHLPPANFLIYDIEKHSLSLKQYWKVKSLPEVQNSSLPQLKQLTYDLLKTTVRQQLISDVPLGVFLSGGTDSTIVTGLAKQTKADIHTYTVVFDDLQLQSYNEQRIARITSNHLHTTHNELVVSSPNPLEMLNLVEFFDQPFGNPTSYLMWLISKYAREHIVVALCGAGGDELYAGYPRYLAAKLASILKPIPYKLFRPIKYFADHLSDKYKTPRIRRIKKFLHGLNKNFTHQFMKWTYFMDEPQKQMLLANHDNSIAPSVRILDNAFDGTFSDFNNLLLMDTQTFLPNNLLEYTDKMAMATALEVRVPFLDHNFIEFSLNVPFHLKLRGTKTKWLLKQTFKDFFAKEALQSPKKGFNVPLAQWMSKHLDVYFQASQNPKHPSKKTLGDDVGVSWKQGPLNWDYIQRLRTDFLNGRWDYSYELFSIIQFDVWWRKYIKRSLPFVYWQP